MSLENGDIEDEPWRTVEYGNLALVRAVKKRPCLYNNTIPEYSQKDVTRAAWEEIAQEFGCSAMKCKKKWKLLRIAYFRKKNEQCFTHKKKPYYLDKHMSFLLPFTHSRLLLQKLASLCSETSDNSNETNNCGVTENETQEAVQNIGYEVEIEGHALNNVTDCSNDNAQESSFQDSDNGVAYGDNTMAYESNVVEDRSSNTPYVVKNLSRVKPIVVQIPSCTVKPNYGHFQGVSDNYARDDQANQQLSDVNEPSSEHFQRVSDNYARDDHTDQQLSDVDPNISSNLNFSLVSGGDMRSKFMLSLLPEVYDMTGSEFRVFKRRVLELLDSVKFS